MREFARHCISREKKSITQNNEDLLPKIIQIIKNVKTLCFSSRKFSPNVKSHWPRRWLAKTRTRTLLLTTRPKSDILLNSDRNTKTLYFIERRNPSLETVRICDHKLPDTAFLEKKIHYSKQCGFAEKKKFK